MRAPARVSTTNGTTTCSPTAYALRDGSRYTSSAPWYTTTVFALTDWAAPLPYVASSVTCWSAAMPEMLALNLYVAWPVASSFTATGSPVGEPHVVVPTKLSISLGAAEVPAE